MPAANKRRRPLVVQRLCSRRQQIPVVGRLQELLQRRALMAATAVRHGDLVRDQIRRIRVGRDQIDLQFDSLDTRNMQPVDVERAGMPLLGRLIERRLNLAKFRDECLFGQRVLVVDDEAQRVVAAAAVIVCWPKLKPPPEASSPALSLRTNRSSPLPPTAYRGRHD